MVFASFSTALGAVINALYVVACVYVYVSLIRQIAARISANALEPSGPTFGFAEAALAVALVAFFLLTITLALSVEPKKIGTREIVSEIVFQVGLLLFIVAFLRLRRLDLNLLGGFSKIGLRRTLFTGTVLLIAAYPLIALADVIMQRFLQNGAGSSRQMIVDTFTGSETIGQRVLIIFLASRAGANRRGISFPFLSLRRVQEVLRLVFGAGVEFSAFRGGPHALPFLCAALCPRLLFDHCL